jgi:hypothetical protein
VGHEDPKRTEYEHLYGFYRTGFCSSDSEFSDNYSGPPIMKSRVGGGGTKISLPYSVGVYMNI